jgi:DNA (cytosine-5)-methyltransferase 1
MTTKPKTISLYSGGGGLDYGFEAAGFETVAALDIDHDSCETLHQEPPVAVIERSIFATSTEEILETACVKPGEVDLVIGGPPCQPFSKSGFWVRGDSLRLHDRRADTLSAFMHVIEGTLPKAFLLENVEGLAYARKDEGLQFVLDRIQGINRRTRSSYRPHFEVLSAADFGVPQLRRRFFLVAARDGTRFRFPLPTHRAGDGGLPLLGADALPAHRTTGRPRGHRARSRRRSGRAGQMGRSPGIDTRGNNYLWHTDRGGGKPLFGWRRRYWSFLLKLAKSRPSWTIQAQPGPAIGPFHWANRRLSMRELCRLQTFPDDVYIVGDRGSIQRQIGNAVPSLLAEALGREIRTQLLGTRPPRGGLKLLPPEPSRRRRPKESGQSQSDTGAWSAATPRIREREKDTQHANAAPTACSAANFAPTRLARRSGGRAKCVPPL